MHNLVRPLASSSRRGVVEGGGGGGGKGRTWEVHARLQGLHEGDDGVELQLLEQRDVLHQLPVKQQREPQLDRGRQVLEDALL
jgi:hypothetical protein